MLSGFGASGVPFESCHCLGAITHLAHQLLGLSRPFVKVPAIELDEFNLVFI